MESLTKLWEVWLLVLNDLTNSWRMGSWRRTVRAVDERDHTELPSLLRRTLDGERNGLIRTCPRVRYMATVPPIVFPLPMTTYGLKKYHTTKSPKLDQEEKELFCNRRKFKKWLTGKFWFYFTRSCCRHRRDVNGNSSGITAVVLRSVTEWDGQPSFDTSRRTFCISCF